MKFCDFPTKEEQEFVKKYVTERPLDRPNVTYLKAFIIILLFICGTLFFAWISYFFFSLAGFYFDKKTYLFIFSIAICSFFSRWLAILFVKLYQHYAPEKVRRRCLLKPTCSEYAIIVLKKYGFLIGVIKIWFRLVFKCCGNVYYIDEP